MCAGVIAGGVVHSYCKCKPLEKPNLCVHAACLPGRGRLSAYLCLCSCVHIPLCDTLMYARSHPMYSIPFSLFFVYYEGRSKVDRSQFMAAAATSTKVCLF